MRASSDDRFAIWRGTGATLAVARHPWEMSPSFSGDALVVTDGDLAVVADASIYYRDDLRAALARAHVGVTGPSASHLILAAYRAWGADCAARLEGDFAFVIWDALTHTVVAARDFSGKRTLYYSERGGSGGRRDARARVHGGRRARAARREHGAQPHGDRRDGGGTLGRKRGDVLRSPCACCRAARRSRESTALQCACIGTGDLPRASTRDAPPFEEAAIELRKLLTRAVERATRYAKATRASG